MRIEDFDYHLPPDRIAQVPLPRREDARLLVVERETQTLHDARIPDLPEWLESGDVLVLNETRVRPARLLVRRPTGGRVELLFVRPEPGPAEAGETWRVLARPGRGARVGSHLESDQGDLALDVVGVGSEGERVVRIRRGDLASTLARSGEIPLPPYIHRAATAEDRVRYQTVYARVEGAVAAPTAGLHFAPVILDEIQRCGVRIARVILHVGPGTFRPIVAADPRDHVMDEEYFEVTAETAAMLRIARAEGRRILPVGTTTVRALESACDAHQGTIEAASGWTRKFIIPPYRFQAADGLMTNFHLPRTTLLLLVAAFTGEDLLRRVYRHAIEAGYRFYSYGDAMLVV